MKTRSFVTVVLFATLAAFCLAQDSNSVKLPEPPYYAEITTNDVYVRSGPGTQHYFTGKLNRGSTVKILSHKFTWSLILPPEGSFSWISKQYVTIDKTNPDIGIVTGDDVRVYAGSDFVAPIHSDRVQVRLNKGSKVGLLGEEIGDYYKIKPPDGAYLWVSTEYTRPLPEPVLVQPVEVKAPAAPKPVAEPAPTVAQPAAVPAPSLVPTTVSPESEPLRQFYALQELFKQQAAKPLAEQDFLNIKSSLEVLAKDESSGRAARYAEFIIEQIKRYELAAAVERQSQILSQQVQETYQNLDESLEEKLAEIPDYGRFAVIGTLRMSQVYSPQPDLMKYVILNPAGKIICYAAAVGNAVSVDLSPYIDQKVGLIGSIEPHPQTAGALVRFTAIEKMQ